MNVKRPGRQWIWSLLLIVVLQAVTTGANQCTQVLSRSEVQNVLKQVPCIEKYQARCAWLSLNYCTFYHTTLCDKNVTETIKIYYIKTDCCQGYFRANNGSCIKKRPGVDYEKLMATSTISSEDPGYVRASIEKKTTLDSAKPVISGGGYAGIICGMILIVSIICFIVIAVRKRKRKRNAKPDPAQQVLYISPPNSPTVRSNSNQIQQTVFQRENTPSSSNRITPPCSPSNVTVVAPPGSPAKITVVTPPASPSKIPVVNVPAQTSSVPIISKHLSQDSEATPLDSEDTHLDSEDTPLYSEDTPLKSEATPLNIEEITHKLEVSSAETADSPLVFNIDNLDDNLPESDI